MSFSQKPAYLIYNSQGEAVNYEDLVAASQKAQVVLFGELHNNPICHWLQLQLTKSLFEAKGRNLKLGGEMFEADAQTVLNEYLAELIKTNHFETEGKVWQNYKTDYAPLVEFAKERQLKFTATNIPRRYANMVARLGLTSLDSISKDAKKWMAPLPIKVDMNLPGYKKMIDMMGGGHSGPAQFSAQQFVHAQAIKDATMAYFIHKNLGVDDVFLHFNGAYHSNHYEGIVWYLKNLNPNLSIITISSVEAENVSHFDENNLKLADFIIAIPSDMTKTY